MRGEHREYNVRAEAVKSLCRIMRDGKYPNLELGAAMGKAELSHADRSLYAALVYGVCERALTLDYVIANLTGRDTGTLDGETLSALRVGLYQIYYMDKIPPHAAVNETVAASPARSRGLVNAVLRRALREGGALDIPDGDASLLYSLPEWIVELWHRDYPDDADALCASVNRRPDVTLCVNTQRTSAEAVLEMMANHGAEAVPNAFFGDMIDVRPAGVPVTELPGFDDGNYFVQDAASNAAVRILDVRPGMRVADVCAAPGGKSLAAAIMMENSGEVDAFDIHENKLGLLRASAQRLGIGIISTSVRDARDKDCGELRRAFDRVICDVPCSGLGVIAKKPDIRYKSEVDVRRLPEIQSAILSSSAELVKDGGVLVYSTCTLRRAENDDIVDDFLHSHDDFTADTFTLPHIGTASRATFMPNRHGTDGFFAAKLRRIK